MIRLRGLHFRYPEGSELLRGCHLEVRDGEVVALVGPNGSGKTTLLKIAAGLLKPAAGTAELDGRPVSGWERIPRAKRLSYVPQRPLLPEDWPVGELVALGDFPHRERPPAPRPLPERLAEAGRALELENIWGRQAGTLSGGEAQRVALARALVQDAPAMVLDEPASHLDLRHQMALYAHLANLASKGRAVLLSTHDVNLSRLYGQRLVVLDGAGTLRDLPQDPTAQGGLLAEVFGVPFLPQDHAGVTCWFPEVGKERAGEPESRGAGENAKRKKEQ